MKNFPLQKGVKRGILASHWLTGENTSTLVGIATWSVSRPDTLVDDNQEVEGMLLVLIPNARSIEKLVRITADEFSKWGNQISEAIQYLHSKRYV